MPTAKKRRVTGRDTNDEFEVVREVIEDGYTETLDVITKMLHLLAPLPVDARERVLESVKTFYGL